LCARPDFAPRDGLAWRGAGPAGFALAKLRVLVHAWHAATPSATGAKVMSEPATGQPGTAAHPPARKSLSELLYAAASFETAGRDTFTLLAPRVSGRIRGLVELLAEVQAQHLDRFTDVAEGSDPDLLMQVMIETPAAGQKFNAGAHAPVFGAEPDDREVLDYALQREELALQQYRALAQRVPAGPARELFSYLARDDAAHRVQLERLYAEVLRDTG
jgi:rubrerythrin